ncbi:hypothetical protein EVAR_34555_1 [Eumeta japonica]|uniref:Uncharacterized protein n=1 Tax=Eumeta variegata TaxID=151549 RepID=A0A4C1X5X1_EUMVA|nr:hypothetical protein EVAR_34555_1 [Eumeta japonica]
MVVQRHEGGGGADRAAVSWRFATKTNGSIAVARFIRANLHLGVAAALSGLAAARYLRDTPARAHRICNKPANARPL